MTHDNRAWALTEAKRRAAALDGAYSVYRKDDDYIIKTAESAPPKGWDLFATFQPDGAQTFGRPGQGGGGMKNVLITFDWTFKDGASEAEKKEIARGYNNNTFLADWFEPIKGEYAGVKGFYADAIELATLAPTVEEADAILKAHYKGPDTEGVGLTWTCKLYPGQGGVR